jgi:hypothetical protein
MQEGAKFDGKYAIANGVSVSAGFRLGKVLPVAKRSMISS